MDGRKYDHDKPKWHLLPFREVEEIVKVLTFGAEKYEEENWKRVTDARKRYFSAILRHLVAWWNGEREDSESKYSHLAHAGCCILFLMWFDNQRGNDDK